MVSEGLQDGKMDPREHTHKQEQIKIRMETDTNTPLILQNPVRARKHLASVFPIKAKQSSKFIVHY